jgi:hypothetical protein
LDGGHDAVRRTPRPPERRYAGALQGPGARHRQQGQPSRDQPQVGRQRRSLALDVGAQQGLHYDRQGQLVHGGAQVERIAG